MLLSQYKAALDLESYLGDPAVVSSPFSYQCAIEYDEQEAYPEQICKVLSGWGLQKYYVLNGMRDKRHVFEELLLLVRVVARRDFTSAWVHGVNSLLGTMAIWVAGSKEQQQHVSNLILEGKQIAVAYHEKTHGNDLLANEVKVRSHGEDYHISGEKWVIGNATRGAGLTIFARTGEKEGPRSFSLFFVDKSKLRPESYRYLPAFKTHGIRGADVSGIRLQNSVVPSTALIGRRGEGMETTLKAFQITRVIMPALSLGAADTALRTAVSFSCWRKLYGKSVADIPYVRQQLVEAFSDLLICECISIVAARSLHVLPQQASVFSAITKYLVPLVVDGIFKRLSTLLGARHFLRDEHYFNIFQKMMRDQGCVSIGHVGSHINLYTISQQLPQLLGGEFKFDKTLQQSISDVEPVFDLATPLPRFEAEKLSLFSRGTDDVVRSMIAVRDAMKRADSRECGLNKTEHDVLAITDEIITRLHFDRKQFNSLSNASSLTDSQNAIVMMKMAKRYCYTYGAACCLQLCWYNRPVLHERLSTAEWLVIALSRLSREMKPGVDKNVYQYIDNVFDSLMTLKDENQMFSVIPFSLGRGEGRLVKDKGASQNRILV